MSAIKEFWIGLDGRARSGIVVGGGLIVAMAIGLAVWAYRPDYQVLFADLAPRDAAAMTAELDKMKSPYRLSDGGNTILVPQEQVYRTRLKLMGKDVPLHGAVGFEVFNNADFGMTEFVQKVNYQRAVQGELTRTIQAIDDVLSARVHLAIPEQGLFKKSASAPKASVTVSMKPGRTLGAAQIAGIQRLVAASVPDISSNDVTVLDQHGVALTRPAAADAGVEATGTQLDSKRSAEEYLVKKVNQVLEQTFGAGQAAASVDVVLNLDQSKITTEEVMPARSSGAGGVPTGVVVKERISSHDGEPGAAIGTPPARPGAGAGSTSRESDYQVGRRVEQLAVASGTVRRMTVAVLVKQDLSANQMAQLKDVVTQAVGVNPGRGDTVVVHSMEEFAAVGRAAPAAGAPLAAALDPAPAPAPAVDGGKASERATVIIAVLIGLLALALAAAVSFFSRRRLAAPAAPRALDEAAREQMLAQVRQWIEQASEVPAVAPK